MPDLNPWNAEQPFDKSSLWPSSRPIIRSMCRRTSGDPNKGWQQYILEKYLYPALAKWEQFADARVKAAKYIYPIAKRPEEYRCLILGSNEGGVERELCRWGFAGEIVASDIAENALNRAREQALALGYNNIRHVKADLNADHFDGKFDFIIAEGVLHHITNLERCLEMLRNCLDENGILIAAEFVGPYRFQLPPIQVAWINALLGILPQGLGAPTEHYDPRMPASAGRNHSAFYTPRSEEEIASFDPSEAISGHILKSLLPKWFDLVEKISVGGTITTYLHELIDYNKTNQPPYEEWMELAIHIEDLLIRQGVLESDYVFYIGRRTRT